jgi:hypothetical protein
MFQLAKTVLQSISFDSELFKKEYFKMIQWLPPTEVKQLTNWCIQNFDVDFLTRIGIL